MGHNVVCNLFLNALGSDRWIDGDMCSRTNPVTCLWQDKGGSYVGFQCTNLSALYMLENVNNKIWRKYNTSERPPLII